MKIPVRFVLIAALVLIWQSLSFGAEIVPDFNSTSDGRNDDGTYTNGGCFNDSPGGTCTGDPVPIGFDINFFGTLNNSVFINTNGNVTFDSPLAAFIPFPLDFALRPIVAPFFADVDTRNADSGVVTFGNGFFGGRDAFGVNWIDVGYFDQHADKTNSFQLLFVNRADTGAGNFDLIFNYDRVQWETGDGDFGDQGLGGFSARVGFTNGSGIPEETLELPGSGEPGSLIDGGPLALISHRLNSDVDGRYIFNFREGQLSATTVPEPASMLLVALAGALLMIRRRYA